MTHDGLFARLLSRRNRLSRIEKEQILAHVLDSVAPGARRRRTAWLALGLGLGAVAAVAVMVVSLPSGPGAPDEFTARGGEQPVFHAHCGDLPCRAGATLVFEVAPGQSATYFAAFARRGDGTVIWYFPETATGSSKDLSRELERGILRTGIALGPEHTAGDYEITGVFSAQPLDRAAIKALVTAGGAGLVKRTVVIQ